MITVVYSTKESVPEFQAHIRSKIGPTVEILEYINPGLYSLTEIYNRGLKEAQYDTIIFCHNDLIFETDNIAKKIVKHFTLHPEYGILTIASTTELGVTGQWWASPHLMLGQVTHQWEGRRWLSKYSENLGVDTIVPVVLGDGLFFAVNRQRIKSGFDERLGGFHFYDISFCLANHLMGVSVGHIYNIKLVHKSPGFTGPEWEAARLKFLDYYGSELPLNIKPYEILFDRQKVVLIPIKKEPRVNIIILSKDRNDLLFQCLDSLYRSTRYKNFKTIVVDTGSSEQTLNEIEERLGNTIKLVKYDYYNFARVNNDVVANHLDDNCDLLLFCNNDIKFLDDNDALSQMVDVWMKTHNIGTVGANLFFEDLRVQHSGQLAIHHTKNNSLQFGHVGYGTYYNYHLNNTNVLGNTGALMLTSKKTFNKIGGFNEAYTSAFEDLEFNMRCITQGYVNVLCGNACAYHFESQTRGEQKVKGEQHDMQNVLLPYVSANFERLKKYILSV